MASYQIRLSMPQTQAAAGGSPIIIVLPPSTRNNVVSMFFASNRSKAYQPWKQYIIDLQVGSERPQEENQNNEQTLPPSGTNGTCTAEVAQYRP